MHPKTFPFAVLAALLISLAPARASRDETLLLEVVINGFSSGKTGIFTLRNGKLVMAQRKELRDLGFRVADLIRPRHGGLIPLSALQGVTTHLDQPTQTLFVTAPASDLLPALLHLRGTGTSPLPTVQSGTGLTLNYDLTDTALGTSNVASGLFDVRAFSPWGVVSSQALAYATFGGDGGQPNSPIRLDSTYTYSDPANLRRFRAGDFISGGLGWTRPVRMGGVQVDSDFTMRPDLVTSPLPVISGTAAVPSTLNVLVNGNRILSQQVRPGPFQIPRLPVVNGSGTVTMTLTDALGRQTTTTLPFYASNDLLAAGLQSYSLEAGAVRQNWGIISNGYGAPAGSATYRRGVTADLTAEAHAEGTAGAFMAGGGLVMNVADLALVDGAIAVSGSGGRTGLQLSAGATRSGRRFSVGARVTIADPTFRDIASENGDPVPTRQINLNASVAMGRFGSLGAAYTGIAYNARPAPISFLGPTGGVVSVAATQHAQILSASYSVQLGRLSVAVTGFHDFATGGDTGVTFGLTIPFGPRSWGNLSGGSAAAGAYAQVQAGRSATTVGQWGYQAYAATGQPDHEFAQLRYLSPLGLVSAGLDRLGRQTTAQVEAQGALAFADGGLFVSNTINDSFAVVDTDGAKGVRVLDENRFVGRTDSAGRLLVPDLRSFDINHLSIDPANVPIDATIPYTQRDVRPQDRSGVVVHFPVKDTHGALVRLVDGTGKPIPVGSAATLQSGGVAVPVGYDGDAYVQDLGPRNILSVQRPDGASCVVRFAYHAVPDDIPTIGPLRCVATAP